MQDTIDGVSRRAAGVGETERLRPPMYVQESLVNLYARLAVVVECDGSVQDWIAESPLDNRAQQRASLQPLELGIREALGFIEEVFRQPRSYLRVEVARVQVGAVRRPARQAQSFLSSHTEDWAARCWNGVAPTRLLSELRDTDLDIYENRLACRLVDNLLSYLGERIDELNGLLRLFKTVADYRGSAEIGFWGRSNRIYSLWGESGDAGAGRELVLRSLRVLTILRGRLGALRDSALYRSLPRERTAVQALVMTNVLGNDQHYRRVAELWHSWLTRNGDAGDQAARTAETLRKAAEGFELFLYLLVVRALDQLGFQPAGRGSAIRDEGVGFLSATSAVSVTWASSGAIVVGRDDRPLMSFIPAFVYPTAPGMSRQRQHWLASVASGDSDTCHHVYVYLSPVGGPEMEEGHSPDFARLRSLGLGSTSQGSRRTGFVPVSPGDIESVERLSRALRWAIWSDLLLRFPTRLKWPPELPGPTKKTEWLTAREGSLFFTGSCSGSPYSLLGLERDERDTAGRLEAGVAGLEELGRSQRTARGPARAAVAKPTPVIGSF